MIMASCLGRQMYIDHLATHISIVVGTTKGMFKELEALRRDIVSTGEHGQRFLNFLDQVNDHYKQIRCFYSYNSRGIGNAYR